MSPKRRALTAQQAGLTHGWRSGLEEAVGDSLKERKARYEYEPFVIPYVQPTKPRRYTPDYLLLANGIIIETKGRFVTADRQKHLMVKEQHPNLDIRFVFSNPKTRISKQSQTTYAQWCELKGFKYAAKDIPDAWLKEPPNPKAVEAVKKLRSNTAKKR